MPQHHFRMISEIAVDRDSIRCLAQMHPVRLNIDSPVPLLQEDDIRGDLRAGIDLESVVGQTYSAQQLSPLRYVLSDFW